MLDLRPPRRRAVPRIPDRHRSFPWHPTDPSSARRRHCWCQPGQLRDGRPAPQPPPVVTDSGLAWVSDGTGKDVVGHRRSGRRGAMVYAWVLPSGRRSRRPPRRRRGPGKRASSLCAKPIMLWAAHRQVAAIRLTVARRVGCLPRPIRRPCARVQSVHRRSRIWGRCSASMAQVWSGDPPPVRAAVYGSGPRRHRGHRRPRDP